MLVLFPGCTSLNPGSHGQDLREKTPQNFSCGWLIPRQIMLNKFKIPGSFFTGEEEGGVGREVNNSVSRETTTAFLDMHLHLKSQWPLIKTLPFPYLIISFKKPLIKSKILPSLASPILTVFCMVFLGWIVASKPVLAMVHHKSLLSPRFLICTHTTPRLESFPPSQEGIKWLLTDPEWLTLTRN